MHFSVSEYLEDLLLATDSEDLIEENPSYDEEFVFEIPAFIREQVSF